MNSRTVRAPLGPRLSKQRLSIVAATLLVTAGAAQAQRQHVSDLPPGSGLLGLIGEPPDLARSTWVHPAAPDGNPFPRSTAPAPDQLRRDTKVLLGKVLFWEEQVSMDNTVGCCTCHDPAAGGADLRVTAHPTNGTFGSPGVIPQAIGPVSGTIDYGFVAQPTPTIDRSVTPIIAPTMIGAYLFNQQFWDMRAGPTFQFEAGGTIPGFGDWAACESLATGPPLSAVEMGHEGLAWANGTLQTKLGTALPMALCDPNPAKMPPDFLNVRNLGLDYNTLFDLVFATDPNATLAAGPGVTRERFAAAVAHYMRTLIPDQAPIDTGTMTQSQQNGFNRMANGGCFACHSVGNGIALSSPAGGFVDPFDAPFSDGRFHAIRPSALNVKTPTLRNIGLKKRFFTDGQVNSITGLLAFYRQIFGFNLTAQETVEVTDFLVNGLLDQRVALRLPPFDKPELASERPENAFESNEFGAPVSGLSTPEIIANAPPHVPNTGRSSFFKVGVANCLPGSAAVLGLQFPPAPGLSFLPFTTVNAAGFATTHFPIPAQTGSALIGLTVIGKWFVQDAGAPGGIAQSDSAHWTLFQL